MKSKWLIEQRLANEDDVEVIKILKWVLESPECPLCAHKDRRDWEIQIFNGAITTAYLEAKNNWEALLIHSFLFFLNFG